MFDNLTDEMITEYEDSTSSIFIYAWPYQSEFRIKLTVTESNGHRCFVEKVYFDEDCFEPCPPIGGGAVPIYKDEIPEPPCDVRVIKVYFTDIESDQKKLEQITVKVKYMGGPEDGY